MGGSQRGVCLCVCLGWGGWSEQVRREQVEQLRVEGAGDGEGGRRGGWMEGGKEGIWMMKRERREIQRCWGW